jgi:hypothetical protein
MQLVLSEQMKKSLQWLLLRTSGGQSALVLEDAQQHTAVQQQSNGSNLKGKQSLISCRIEKAEVVLVMFLQAVPRQ